MAKMCHSEEECCRSRSCGKKQSMYECTIKNVNNFPPSCQGCGDCRFFIAGMLFDGCVEEVNLRVRFFWVIVVGLINLFSKVLYLIC